MQEIVVKICSKITGFVAKGALKVTISRKSTTRLVTLPKYSHCFTLLQTNYLRLCILSLCPSPCLCRKHFGCIFPSCTCLMEPPILINPDIYKTCFYFICAHHCILKHIFMLKVCFPRLPWCTPRNV